MNTTLLTMYSPAYDGISRITLPVFSRYAQKHRYEMYLLQVEDEKYPYKKIWHILKLFETGSDLVGYFDIDILLTNHNIKLSSFINPTHDLFVCKDANGINFGAAIIKNTEWATLFLNQILNYAGKEDNEQNVLNKIYEDHKDKIYLCPHPSFNSYKYELYKEFPEYVGRQDLGDWTTGHFALHTPGLGLKMREEILKNTKIIE